MKDGKSVKEAECELCNQAYPKDQKGKTCSRCGGEIVDSKKLPGF